MITPYVSDATNDPCVVCGKSTTGGGGFCHVQHDGHMVALCCPLCLETFQEKDGIHDTIRECEKLLHQRKEPE